MGLPTDTKRSNGLRTCFRRGNCESPSVEANRLLRAAIPLSHKLLQNAQCILQQAKPSTYDTPENQYIKFILLSAKKHLNAFRNYYTCCAHPDHSELSGIDSIAAMFKKLCRSPLLQETRKISRLPHNLLAFRSDPRYRDLYTNYRSLTRLFSVCRKTKPISAFPLSPFPGSIPENLSAVVWERPDVLVGSVKSVVQFDDNLRRRYYYTPAEYVTGDIADIKYIAIYQSGRLFGSNAGIRYYGKVTKAKRLKREAIDFPFYPEKANDPYCAFLVEKWEVLPAPIAVKDEGVYAPKFTYSFLLHNSSFTYELFNIHSQTDFLLLFSLKNALKGDSFYPIGDSHTIRIDRGSFTILNNRGDILEEIAIDAFQKAPVSTFRRIKKKIERG